MVGPDAGSEKEKAELEGDEKEVVVASCSGADSSMVVARPVSLLQAPSNASTTQCEYQQACITFKASLGLPGRLHTQ